MSAPGISVRAVGGPPACGALMFSGLLCTEPTGHAGHHVRRDPWAGRERADAGIQAETLRDHVHDRLREVVRYEPLPDHVYGDLDEIVTTAIAAVIERLAEDLRAKRRDDLVGYEGAMRRLRSGAWAEAVAVVEGAS